MRISEFLMRLLPNSLVCGSATLGPVGYWGKAPGTLGSFAGLLWYTVCFHPLQDYLFFYLFLNLFCIWVAVFVCGEAEKRFQSKDPSFIILDEFVAIPLCFSGVFHSLPPNFPVWIVLLIGFLLFRFFDILKPFGINKLQVYPNGKGVVYDDLAAAVASCVCLHLGILTTS